MRTAPLIQRVDFIRNGNTFMFRAVPEADWITVYVNTKWSIWRCAAGPVKITDSKDATCFELARMLLTKMDGRDRLIALNFDRLPGASNFDFDDHIEVTATGALRGRTMQPFHLKLRKMELEPDTSFDI